MTPKDRFKGHFEFLEHLDETINDALAQYSGAEEADLEELRHLQREVGMARRTLSELCAKFAPLNGEGEVAPVAEKAVAVSPDPAHDPASNEKSAASL